MANSIACTRNYTSILDDAYKRAACSTCLNSPRRMARAGRNAKEIMVPKIEVTGLGDYTRNVGYKTGSITYELETKTFNYDRGIKLLADIMDVEEADVLDCFVAAGSELQRMQVAPEADAFTFAQTAARAKTPSAEGPSAASLSKSEVRINPHKTSANPNEAQQDRKRSRLPLPCPARNTYPSKSSIR